MDYQKLLAKVEEILTPVLGDLGVELAEREFLQERGRWILRITIDKEGGAITLDDCEGVSKAIEGVLDCENIIPWRYYLEVSSPGIERPLRRLKDFERFKGDIVSIKTTDAIAGRHHFTGILKGFRGDDIVIAEKQKEWLIPYAKLKKARLKQRSG